jgi:putative ABC transport system substrate-binding protein
MRANIGSVEEKRRQTVSRGAMTTVWLCTLWCIVTLVCSFPATLRAAEAQPRAKVPRIGFLGSSSPAPYEPIIDALRQGLRELGWVEGHNVTFEFRWAEGELERLPALATALARLEVDVLVTQGTPAAIAAKHATQTLPIIFVQVGDPLGSGLITSLARPGGNLTGLSLLAFELDAKRLEMLKEAVPKASRVAVLWHPDFSPHVEGLRGLKSAAQALGVELQPVAFRHPQDFEAGFAAMRQGGADALLVMGHPMTFNGAPHLAELAVRGRLPAIALYREFAQAGGLMAYGASIAHLYRRAASYVDKILKGAKPADLPVEQPTTFELIINLKAAQALGITIPPSLLVLADEVFQ